MANAERDSIVPGFETLDVFYAAEIYYDVDWPYQQMLKDPALLKAATPKPLTAIEQAARALGVTLQPGNHEQLAID